LARSNRNTNTDNTSTINKLKQDWTTGNRIEIVSGGIIHQTEKMVALPTIYFTVIRGEMLPAKHTVNGGGKTELPLGEICGRIPEE